ncbi:MAG: sporulation integral membrane protein YtvI [Bacillota bacterium]
MNRHIQTIGLIAAGLALVYFSTNYFLPELLGIISKAFSVIIPFIIASLLALLLEPLVSFLTTRTRMSRSLAVGAAMLTVFGGIGFILFLAILRLVKELIDLSVSLPKYAKPVEEFILYTFQKSKVLYFSLPPEISGRINEGLGTLTGTLSNFTRSLANFLLSLATGVPEAVLGIIVAVIATYFFSRDRQLLVRLWIKTIPAPWGEKSLRVVREIAHAFLSYVRAQAVLVSLTTIQAIAGLYILGAKYALTMGLLIGFFDILPVLGPATIIIPWAVWSFISGNVAFGVKLIVLYAVIWIVRQSLEARVVAANLGLHPLAVLGVMYVGLKLLGVAGLILGPILLIAVQAAFKALRKEL